MSDLYAKQAIRVGPNDYSQSVGTTVEVDPRTLAERLDAIQNQRDDLRMHEAKLLGFASEIEDRLRDLRKHGEMAGERLQGIHAELGALRLLP